MQVIDDLQTKEKWLLAILGTVPHIEGRIRVQKFCLLSFYEVLKDEPFFDDWKADKYGGSSDTLADSLVKLELEGYIKTEDEFDEYNSTNVRYTLTRKGQDIMNDFVASNDPKFKKIKAITNEYYDMPLSKFLMYVIYKKYPDLILEKNKRGAPDDECTRQKILRSLELDEVPKPPTWVYDLIKANRSGGDSYKSDPVEILREVRGC